MTEFEKQIEPNSPWVRLILERLEKEKPRFASNGEAIAFYERALAELAERRSITVTKLIELATSSGANEEDFDLALSLSSKIFGLRTLKK